MIRVCWEEWTSTKEENPEGHLGKWVKRYGTLINCGCRGFDDYAFVATDPLPGRKYGFVKEMPCDKVMVMK